MGTYKNGYHTFKMTYNSDISSFLEQLKPFILENTTWELSEETTSTALVFNTEYEKVKISSYGTNNVNISITSSYGTSSVSKAINVAYNSSGFSLYLLTFYVMCKDGVTIWKFVTTDMNYLPSYLFNESSFLYNYVQKKISYSVGAAYFEMTDGVNTYPVRSLVTNGPFIHGTWLSAVYLKDNTWTQCKIGFTDHIDGTSSYRDLLSNTSYINNIPVISTSDDFIGIISNIKRVSRNGIKTDIIRLQYPFENDIMKYEYILYPYAYIYDKDGD